MSSEELPTTNAPGESSEWSLMLSWIQTRIILSGFDNTFTAEQDEMAISFVSDPNMRRLLAVTVDGKLQMATNDFESLATSDAKVHMSTHVSNSRRSPSQNHRPHPPPISPPAGNRLLHPPRKPAANLNEHRHPRRIRLHFRQRLPLPPPPHERRLLRSDFQVHRLAGFSEERFYWALPQIYGEPDGDC